MKPLFVLDASVSAGWIFKDQASDYSRRVLASLADCACLLREGLALASRDVKLISAIKKAGGSLYLADT